MRKQTKTMAALSAAFVLSAAMPAFFTTDNAHTIHANTFGWVEEEGTWRYFDADGYYLTDSWKKKDNDWYYLNSDGDISRNELIEGFYVDEDGKMVENKWISVANEVDMDSPEAPEFYWYYFGKDGKAITSKWYSIDENWYYFNEDGHMVTGKAEIDNATYYLGADGIMKKGWIQLSNDSNNPETSDYWYYFDRNGKMVENAIDYRIGDHYYTFVNGKMQTGWFKLPADASSENADATASNATASNASQADSVKNYQYYETDGKRAEGWYTIAGVPGISEEYETFQFYFKKGKAHSSEKGLDLFTIDSKKYAFNEKGEMQTGIKTVNVEDGKTARFYFGTDGIMKTGKQVIYNAENDQYETYFFYSDGSKKGQGFHGLRDNAVYVDGLRQDADGDLRYAPAVFEGTTYLVNTSGSIQKASGSSRSSAKPELGTGYKDLKDANGKIWVVNTQGIIQ